ncbi:MAG TPA: YitT family protein [Syntrophomonadaceae bacterium]|nr:YitT family protein [Syntrophomonadaceae bacterium]
MKNLIKAFLLLTLGSFMDAAGFYFWLAPNDIAAGGINGLSLALNSFFPQLPLGLFILVMSIFLLIIGFLVIGPVFGLKTIYCSLAIPLMIWGMELFFPLQGPLTDDVLIQLFFGVLISSTGLAILFNQNASSGGTDILARILNKFYHIEMGKSLLIIDFGITLFAAYTFGIQKGLYALLGVILYGYTIDYVIEGMNVKKYLTIITDQSEAVKNFIVQELGRGATIYTARGAYTDENREVLVTIVNRREFIRLRQYIQRLDRNAFITIQNVHEVLGEGFEIPD